MPAYSLGTSDSSITAIATELTAIATEFIATRFTSPLIRVLPQGSGQRVLRQPPSGVASTTFGTLARETLGCQRIPPPPQQSAGYVGSGHGLLARSVAACEHQSPSLLRRRKVPSVIRHKVPVSTATRATASHR